MPDSDPEANPTGGGSEQRAVPHEPDDEAQTIIESNHAPLKRPRGEGAPCVEAVEVVEAAEVAGYRLVRKLGQGGMGVVYEAEHAQTGRPVALKLLSPDLPHSDETAQRFLNEASLAAALSHPRTTFVYEAGEVNGDFFIAMELMPGRTLSDLVREEGPMPLARAVDAAIDVLDGLGAAHRIGVIHRDVKPSNCFLDREGRVKVGDFGLSKSLVVESELTRTGTFLGTPQFCAPEQIRGGTVDARTDLFSVAATLFYLIAGRAPFTGDPAAVIAQIVADDAPPLNAMAPAVPKALARAVARGLARAPARRFKDAAAFRQALDPFSTSGTAIADVGRRAAGFLIDITVVSIAVGIAYPLLSVASGGSSQNSATWFQGLPVGVAILCYFLFSEGLFGRTLGKRWLGLRVFGPAGEPPGFGRALVRSLILPGLAWIPIDIAQHRMAAETYATFGQEVAFDAWSHMVVPQLLSLAKFGFCLAACATMRRSNGMRGLHELLSGTRVMRVSGAEPAPEEPEVPAYLPAAETGTAGPFEIEGRLGGSNGSDGGDVVMVARDRTLDRRVWIFRGAQIAMSPRRLHVSRPTRLRWLLRGTDAQGDWQAFEAAEGAPLTDVAASGTLRWPFAGRVLLAVAEELQAAIEDDTLPAELDVSQVWVGARGEVKLLDRPPRRRREDDEAAVSRCGEDGAGEFLGEVAALCGSDERAPAGALDLFLMIATPPEGTEAMNPGEAAAALRGVLGSPYRLGWDDRLGILAISSSVETVLYTSAPMMLGVAMRKAAGLELVPSVLIATSVALAIPAIVGYFARGGPAFLITKTRVRAEKPGAPPASPIRCAWRNVIAWMPMGVLQASLAVWLSELSASFRDGSMVVNPGSSPADIAISWAVVGLILAGVTIMMECGLLFAIIHPRRGVQDILAGTLLSRG